MTEDMEDTPIMLLPNEILSMILMNNNCREILNFGSTCKKFNAYVSTNELLWKEKFKLLLPNNFDYVRMHGDGQWFKEYKRFFYVKHEVFAILLHITSKFYQRKGDIAMRDVTKFFELALDHNLHYYYVITTLKNIVKTATEYLNMNYCERPYTLTEMHYAKIALRYLTHIYLAIKSSQNRLACNLGPEIVLNFFVQWVDASSTHKDEDVDDVINSLVHQVEQIFTNDGVEPNSTVKEKVEKGLLCYVDVLHAVSVVIYQKNHIALMPSANIDTLDIVQVVKSKCGHPVAVAVLYQAVAKKCGMHCDLIAFPNHLFLEWRSPDPAAPAQYRVDLGSGALVTRGRCPYAHGPRDEIKYCPDSFLQYIIGMFLVTMGTLRNWATQNADLLQDFLSGNPANNNQYRHYQEYLQHPDRVPEMSNPLQPEYLDDDYIQMMKHLVSITQYTIPIRVPVTVKKRDPSVMFAVGLICYQQKYDYLCVILDWDTKCSADMRRCEEFRTLRRGLEQPFYSVVAIDQSERYVAQENLLEVARPNRLYHLEDMIGKYFTHFDGFCYIPNQEKEREYPEDGPIRDVFRIRFDLRADRIREVVRRVQV